MPDQRLLHGLCAALVAVGLVSCRPPAEEPAAEEPETGAPTAIDPATDPAPLADSALIGSYEAVSRTAMSITGDLAIAADRLVFTLDQTYETELVDERPASAPSAAGDGTFADVLIVSGGDRVELRRVSAEEVGAAAPNRGLCGPEPTTYVAIASTRDADGDRSLRLAAFKGTQPPGPEADPADLCGTFTYAAAAGPGAP